MKEELIKKLQYTLVGRNESHMLSPCLFDSLKLISLFFSQKKSNKLCLVFPSKELAAQWLSVPTVLSLVKQDYENFSAEIAEAYKTYNKGDKLIINNDAIVEWVGKGTNGFKFKYKEYKEVDTIEIALKNITRLQKAPPNKTILSTYQRLKAAIGSKAHSPIDNLLEIKAEGNKFFQKSKISLVGKFISYENSIANVSLNSNEVNDYFKSGRIDETGKVSETNPLLLANNFASLILHIADAGPVSKIIIDGFGSLNPKNDFLDIDREFNIPTILITDLSEMASFPEIKNFGFEIYNFTKENIVVSASTKHSPFSDFESKLQKYTVFKINRELCKSSAIESIFAKLHSIPREESNDVASILKVSLVQVSNIISRLSYYPTPNQISLFLGRVNEIELHLQKNALWVGNYKVLFEEVIQLLKGHIKDLSFQKTDKCLKLEELLRQGFDYIVCPTEDEAVVLRERIKTNGAKIVSIPEILKTGLSGKESKAILIGWPKADNFNKLVSSFSFSQLTVMFHEFENKYFSSLQKHNNRNLSEIRSTVTSDGGTCEATKSPVHFYSETDGNYTSKEKTDTVDVVDFELTLEESQYSKYSGKGNPAESLKAKRIDFDGNKFLYSIESHKFLVINELIDKARENPRIHNYVVESLKSGDLIAFINTDRDILAELVEKNTNPKDLSKLKEWTGLWKNLLRDYYNSNNRDLKGMVKKLRELDCKKHPATINNWMQDENLIGPDSDDDLRGIALLTESTLLYDNIETVRTAINKMIGLRFQAATLVRDRIKNKLIELPLEKVLSSSFEIQDLGRINVLRVKEVSAKLEDIDRKYIHRIIEKETI